MMTWRTQGAAQVASAHLNDGRSANVVIVAGRENPKGVMIIAPADGGAPEPLRAHLDALSPEQTIDILCAQERYFGTALADLNE